MCCVSESENSRAPFLTAPFYASAAASVEESDERGQKKPLPSFSANFNSFPSLKAVFGSLQKNIGGKLSKEPFWG